MNGKRAKQLRKIAPLILLNLQQQAHSSGSLIALDQMPSLRQVYRRLKHKYTRGL